jgi:translation elongation factor EF-G
LQVEYWLRELENDYARIEIIKSEPIVSYRETITDKSSQVW